MTSLIATAEFGAETSKRDVRIVTIPELDNGDQECPICGHGDAFIEAQLYYTLDGEPVFEEGCETSIAKRIIEIRRLGAEDIQVEVEEQ